MPFPAHRLDQPACYRISVSHQYIVLTNILSKPK